MLHIRFAYRSRVSNSSPWPSFNDEGAELLVVTRYRVATASRLRFMADAEVALDALSAQAGFLRASVGQATDDAELILIRTEWAGVGQYRRALSSYDVKLNAVPLLSTAVDETSAFEVVRDWAGGLKSSASSGRSDRP